MMNDMDNEYEDEEEVETQSGGFFKNFYNNNKKLIWILIIIVVFLLLVILFTRNRGDNPEEPTDEPAVNLVISEKSISLTPNTSGVLELKLDNGDRVTASWESDNPDVATVSDTGIVVGKKMGKANIIATYYDKNNKPYQEYCEVTVHEGNSDVVLNDFSFPRGDLMMSVNTTYNLYPKISPENAFIENRHFTSDDTNIVTVDDNGKVTAVGIGKATISLVLNNRDDLKKSINVIVLEKNITPNILVNPDEISFDEKFIKLKVGETDILEPSYEPDDADLSQLKWTSSEVSIVKVSENGRIEALREGTAIIQVETINGKKDTINIEVVKNIVDVTRIALPFNQLNLNVGQSYSLVPTVEPDDATNKRLIFTSSDETVVTASPNKSGTTANIVAHKGGNATITVQTDDGKFSVTLPVNVTDPNGGNSGVIPGGDSGNNNDSGNNSGNDSGNNSGSPKSCLDYGPADYKIAVRSDKCNLKQSFEEARYAYEKGPTLVKINFGSGVAKVKYCYNRYQDMECTPSIEMTRTSTFELPDGQFYLIRVIKYDKNGNVLDSVSGNYNNGVLNYYLNSKENGASPSKGPSNNSSVEPGNQEVSVNNYTISKVYENINSAKNSPYTSTQTVTINVNKNDNLKKVSFCKKLNAYCETTGNFTDVYSASSFTVSDVGTTYITVREYNNSNQVTRIKYYYITIQNGSNQGGSLNPSPQIQGNITVNWSRTYLENKGIFETYDHVYGNFNVNANKKISKIYYCTTDALNIANNGSSVCSIDTNSTGSSTIYSSTKKYNSNLYWVLKKDKTYAYTISSSSTTFSQRFYGDIRQITKASDGTKSPYMAQRVCFIAKFSDNTLSNKACDFMD